MRLIIVPTSKHTKSSKEYISENIIISVAYFIKSKNVHLVAAKLKSFLCLKREQINHKNEIIFVPHCIILLE